ncbi:antitoxin Xre-like helix-turn-helix domain-containing protein [Pseudomonas sp. RP23018S]|uniref:antitoxin Xre-like helix-turn-helix domain-containing protein n=1 Tax=Pseudomonas sp. RP23018S TaxID=3096037 RepID=UPI002AC9FD03|nr:antitoxin Xre-like helix-turn-helix domain-containing protein [Pseudomonas sp. RP23018S]MDZ5605279.1 antitoxin Xre-like helix-turn-helix domain-containing protein [Pseudomonas sp. RP23018S]
MSTAASTTSNSGKDKGAVALRAAVNIMEKWQATSKQIENVLRISRSTYVRSKDEHRSVSLDGDQLERISLVLNIHASLRTIFDNPENVYGFPSMPNGNEFFDGRPPLDIMAGGSFIQLYETFRRVDVLRGAQW